MGRCRSLQLSRKQTNVLGPQNQKLASWKGTENASSPASGQFQRKSPSGYVSDI